MSRSPRFWSLLLPLSLFTLSGCGITIMAGPGGVSEYERSAYNPPQHRSTVVDHRYEPAPAPGRAQPAPAPAAQPRVATRPVVVGRVDRTPVVPSRPAAKPPRMTTPVASRVATPRFVGRIEPSRPTAPKGTSISGGGTLQDRYDHAPVPKSRVD